MRTFARFGRTVLSALCVVSATGQSVAWPGDTPDVQANRLFAQWDRADSAGCALGIVKDGRIAHSRGYGMADLEHDFRITPATAFYVLT